MSKHNKGYLRLMVDGRRWQAHRFAFVCMGVPAPEIIDHVNGNKADNRWSNLRAATNSQNLMNRSAPKKMTALPKGVRQCGKMFAARITRDGKQYYLGLFKSVSEAVAAYNKAAAVLHREFANVQHTG